jgi:hypothetical protein
MEINLHLLIEAEESGAAIEKATLLLLNLRPSLIDSIIKNVKEIDG